MDACFLLTMPLFISKGFPAFSCGRDEIASPACNSLFVVSPESRFWQDQSDGAKIAGSGKAFLRGLIATDLRKVLLKVRHDYVVIASKPATD